MAAPGGHVSTSSPVCPAGLTSVGMATTTVAVVTSWPPLTASSSHVGTSVTSSPIALTALIAELLISQEIATFAMSVESRVSSAALSTLHHLTQLGVTGACRASSNAATIARKIRRFIIWTSSSVITDQCPSIQ